MRVRLGIGDDAAVLGLSGQRECVVSCDAFLEEVHFRARLHPPDSAGYKALARATSDLAAMGAVPRYFLLALALPAERTGGWLDRFLAGIARAARRFGMVLIGGDTSRHPTVAINVTVLGELGPGRAVTRSGARPGDRIYVSGRLGRAQLGLELLLHNLYRRRKWNTLLAPHLFPELRLSLGQWLARERLASAMIDTSDGLSTDLAHLCESSHVGALLWLERIPAVRVPTGLGGAKGARLDPLELALHGGEDYELLFTAPPRLARKVPASFQGVPLTVIGAVSPEKRIRLVGPHGRITRLHPLGWNHFG